MLAEVQAQVDALLAHWRGLLRQDLELAPAWARVLDDPFLGALALRFLFARAVLANFRPPPPSSASPSPAGAAAASSAPPLQVSAPLISSSSRRRKAEPVPGLTRAPTPPGVPVRSCRGRCASRRSPRSSARRRGRSRCPSGTSPGASRARAPSRAPPPTKSADVNGV